MFILLLNSYVLSNIDYGLSTWAVHGKSKMDSLQRKLDKLITSFFSSNQNTKLIKKSSRSNKLSDDKLYELYETCNIHTIEERMEYYLLLEIHKTMFSPT